MWCVINLENAYAQRDSIVAGVPCTNVLIETLKVNT